MAHTRCCSFSAGVTCGLGGAVSVGIPRVQYAPQKTHSPSATSMADPQDLAAHRQRRQILSVVQDNRVTMIVGDTGCGKSTQVPKILLDQVVVVFGPENR